MKKHIIELSKKGKDGTLCSHLYTLRCVPAKLWLVLRPPYAIITWDLWYWFRSKAYPEQNHYLRKWPVSDALESWSPLQRHFIISHSLPPLLIFFWLQPEIQPRIRKHFNMSLCTKYSTLCIVCKKSCVLQADVGEERFLAVVQGSSWVNQWAALTLTIVQEFLKDKCCMRKTANP